MNRATVLFLGLVWLALLVLIDLRLLLDPAHLEPLLRAELEACLGPGTRFDSCEGDPRSRLVIHGLRIPDEDRDGESLVVVERVIAEVDVLALGDGSLPIRRLRLENIHLDLTPQSIERLRNRPIPEGSRSRAGTVPIEVHGLSARARDFPFLRKRDVDLEFEDFQLALDVREEGEGWSLNASFRDAVAASWSLRGVVGKSYDLRVERLGRLSTAEVFAQLAPEVVSEFEEISFSGHSKLGLRLAGSVGEEPLFQGDLDLEKARIAYGDWPASVEGLSARLAYREGILEAKGLRARVVDGELEGEARIAVASKAEEGAFEFKGLVRSLGVGEPLAARFDALPYPCPIIGEQIRAFDAKGRVDTRVRVWSPPRDDALHVGIDVTLLGAAMRYLGHADENGRRDGVPIPLEDVTGTLEFTELGMKTRGLLARRGPSKLRADATVDYAKKDLETWDIDIRLDGLHIDEALIAGLGTRHSHLLEALEARGRADVRIRPRRSKPGVDDPLMLDIAFTDCSIQPRAFPYPLEGVHGRASIRGEVCTLEGLEASRGPSSFRGEGRLDGIGRRSSVAMRVASDSVAVDARLLAVLERVLPEGSELWKKLLGKGTVAFDLQLRNAIGDPLSVDGKVRLRGLEIALPGVGCRVEIPEASFTLDGRDLSFEDGSSARVNGIPFALEGGVKNGRVGLRLVAKRLAMGEALLDSLVPLVPELADPVHRPKLWGEADVVVRLEASGRGEARPELRVAFSGLTVQPAGWATRIENLSCEAVADGDGLGLRKLSASIPAPGGSGEKGEILVSLESAVFERTQGRSSWRLEGLKVDSFPLSRWVLDLVGELGLEEMCPPLAGRCSLDVHSISRRGDELIVAGGVLEGREISVGGDRVTVGELHLEDFSGVWVGQDLEIEGGLRLQGARFGGPGGAALDEAKLPAFRLSVEKGALSVRSQLRVEGMGFLGIPIPWAEARLEGDSRELVLRNLRGRLFDGEGAELSLAGARGDTRSELRLSWGDGGYHVTTHVKRLDLAQLLQHFGRDSGRLAGQANISLDLRGRYGDPGSMVGRGTVAGYVMGLVELPFFLKVITLLDLPALLGHSSRSEISLGFDVRDHLVDFRDLRFGFSGVTLAGAGWITFDGLMGGKLVTSFGGVPGLSSILTLPLSFVADWVEVGGTMSDPIVTLRSLLSSSDGPKIPAARRPKLPDMKPWK